MKRIFLLLLVCLLRAATAHADGTSTVTCGGVDDTAAINNALNGAMGVCTTGTGGGEVLIQPGMCIIHPATTRFNLCSNLTFRGTGPKSILRVPAGEPPYTAIFGATTSLSNVVLKDFKVDQATGATSPQPESGHVINISAPLSISGLTVSGMYFDSTVGPHTIHVENSSDVLRATITNNYFNFNRAGTSTYPNAAVYLDGWQQVVTGNTFLTQPASGATPLSQGADTAVESHGGRAAISNNTANNYATLAKVTAATVAPTVPAPVPNDVVVSGNSATCAQYGMTLAGSARTIQNVSITGNTIHVCNSDRYAPGFSNIFTGVRFDGSLGDMDSLVVANNVVAMQNVTQLGQSYTSASTGGIFLVTPGNLSNVLVSGNIVTNAPISGIRVGSSSTTGMLAQRIRVNDNVIVDAGNNNSVACYGGDAIYRHGLGLWGTVREVDLMRNMVYDSGSSVNGCYSLYLNQTASPASTNVRTSQNTVRVAGSGALRAFQIPDFNAGLVDATNANDVQVLTQFQGGTVTAAQLPVDFMSFTRYITTITGSFGTSLLVNVPPPPVDMISTPPAYTNWTVGQLVTFRFNCLNQNLTAGCLVTFDNAYSLDPTEVTLPITRNTGRAITFQVESFGSTGKRFFELYRTPPAGVPAL